MGKETKTEIRGSDGSKFEEESMWQGKSITEWTLDEKNHFLTLLIEKCWHEWEEHREGGSYWYQCKFCGVSDSININFFYADLSRFKIIKSFMEKNLPEVLEGYLQYHIDWIDYEEIKATNTLSAWLDPTNLITFLLDNQEGWAWKECGVCKGDSCPHWGIVNVGELMSLQWYGCLTAGKIKHPALLFAEGIK